MIVRFVKIGGIVDHHCLNFLFIMYTKDLLVVLYCPMLKPSTREYTLFDLFKIQKKIFKKRTGLHF